MDTIECLIESNPGLYNAPNFANLIDAITFKIDMNLGKLTYRNDELLFDGLKFIRGKTYLITLYTIMNKLRSESKWSVSFDHGVRVYTKNDQIFTLGNDITLSDYKEILAAIMNNTGFDRKFKDTKIDYYPYDPDEGFVGLYIRFLREYTARYMDVNSAYFVMYDIVSKLMFQ